MRSGYDACHAASCLRTHQGDHPDSDSGRKLNGLVSRASPSLDRVAAARLVALAVVGVRRWRHWQTMLPEGRIVVEICSPPLRLDLAILAGQHFVSPHSAAVAVAAMAAVAASPHYHCWSWRPRAPPSTQLPSLPSSQVRIGRRRGPRAAPLAAWARECFLAWWVLLERSPLRQEIATAGTADFPEEELRQSCRLWLEPNQRQVGNARGPSAQAESWSSPRLLR